MSFFTGARLMGLAIKKRGPLWAALFFYSHENYFDVGSGMGF